MCLAAYASPYEFDEICHARALENRTQQLLASRLKMTRRFLFSTNFDGGIKFHYWHTYAYRFSILE